MKNQSSVIYQTPTVEILLCSEDVVSTSAIELPFIPAIKRFRELEDTEIL